MTTKYFLSSLRNLESTATYTEIFHKGVYALYNDSDDCLYVGSSLCFINRWISHLSPQNRLLKEAFTKAQDTSTWYFQILELVEVETELIYKEQLWIDRLKPSCNLERPVSVRKMVEYLGEDYAKEEIQLPKTKSKKSTKFKGIRCWLSANQLKSIFSGYYGRILSNEELAELFKDLTEERIVSMIEEMALDQLVSRRAGALTSREFVVAPLEEVKPIVKQEPDSEEVTAFGELDFDAALDAAFDD